jgi:predicted DNA-binding protein YlxM (UPF0122 family)
VYRFYLHHDVEFSWFGIEDTPENALIATGALLALGLISGFKGMAGQQRLADYYIQVHLFFLKGEKGSELDNSVRQQEIYENVRFGDLSLSEAAASYGISRQGIHDMLKRADEALEAYEAKLGLVEKYLQDRKDGQKIRELAERIRSTGDMALLDGITALARQIEER